LSSILLKQDRL